MQKKLRLLTLLLGMSITASAQLHFSGKVLDDQNGKPLTDATVLLQARRTHADRTGPEGGFSFSGLPSGNYTLTVRYIGYRTITKTIVLDQDVSGYTVRLTHTGLFVKPVEISSLRAGKDAPFTRSELSAEDLKKDNLGQDIPYLLNQLPSVVTGSDAGAGVGYTSLWVRGTDASRINATINGIPMNDAESSAAIWVDLPDLISSTGSLQLQRGAGTSTNGAGAFGATLNLSTNEFHEKAYGEIDNSYGSFNTWKHTVKAGTGLLNNHFTVDARLSSITSDGYIDRATSDLKSFYTSFAYLNKKTSLRFNLFSGKEKTYQAWNGVPEDTLKAGNRTYNGLGLKPDGSYYENQTDNYLQTYYQLFLNQEINERWNFNVAAFLTRGKGYYEEYLPDESLSGYGIPDVMLPHDTIRQTDLVRDRWLDNYFYGTVFSLNHTGKGPDWNLGGGWNRYDGKHYGEVIWAKYGADKDFRYYYNMAHKYDFNLYWKGEQAIAGGLKAFLDIQYRSVQYNINGFDKNPDLVKRNHFDFFNPKAGLSYRLSPKDRLYASYAVAHKEPNRDDFEANTEKPPKAEQLQDLEAGYDRNGDAYRIHANVYYMSYRNQLVPTGRINDVGAFTRSNIPESYRLGLELSGTVRFARIFSAEANAAFSRNRIDHFTEYIDDYDEGGQKKVEHGETDIAFSPDVVAGFTFTATPLKNLDISVLGKYVSLRYLDNTSDKDRRSLDPYFVNTLRINYTWHLRWIKEIGLNLLVNNLFNTRYNTNGYTYSYIEDGALHTENSYFPQAGTNFLVGVSLGF
ncbi:TonB-dependent receptor [Compostibacter hankyongensis]|uniref:TonB-dependent receptor n=1 Tax=Compostibacter hankyongensis TaxID=1007089 RepID=A0ABP8FJ73_9BACT